MSKINLPVRESYWEFASKYKDILKGETVYKILFTDGYFYIGRSHNLVSRMYNHTTMRDAIGCKKYTKKHKRMIRAIGNSEIVEFTIISDRMSDERKFIVESEEDVKCLNMKR